MKKAPTLDSESRLIVDSIPGNVALLSATGEVEVVNPQLLEYFGQTLEELKQWGTNGTVHPEDLPHVAEVFTKSIAEGTPYEIVQRLRRADGVFRWMENKGLPLCDQNGQIRRWCVLLTDIDERKRAELSLQQRGHDLQLIIDTIPALAWSNGSDGSASFVNRRWLDYTGQSAEEALGWGWKATIHPDDLPALEENWQSSLASGTPVEAEARLRRFDGAYRWFLHCANPVADESEKIVKWYGTCIDIEDRKRAEKAQRARERDLRSIINTIPTHIYVLNTDGSVQHVNQAVMDYTGLSMEDVQQEDYRDRVIHPDDFKRVREPRAAGLRSGAPFSTEQRVLGDDGQYRWFLVRYKPLLDENEGIVRWYVAAFDIEDRKQAEAELRRAYNSFADAQRLSKTGSFITDLVADDHKWSDEAHRIFGFDPRTKVTVKKIRDVIHPEDIPVFEAAAERARSGENVEFGYRIVTASGEMKHIHAVAHVTEHVEGRPLFVGALRDVTELKQSEETFRTIVETNPECVKIIGHDGTLHRVNAAGLAMSGAPSEEAILGQCFYDFVAPEDRDRYSEFNEKVCSGHKGFLEFDIITAQGERRHMETHAAPMLNTDGSVAQLGVTRDITERNITLEKLQANQDLLDLAQKSAGAMAFDWHIQEEFNYWSPEQEALYGLGPGEFDGTYQGWKNLIYDVDWPAVLEAISHAQETGNVDAEFRVIWPDGSQHWLATNGRMFFDDAGEPLRMVGFTTDVTGRKMAEVQLAGEKRLLEMVATGRPLTDILTSLCTYVEDIAPECQCGLYLIDWDGPKVQLAIGPTLPAGYNAALEGLHFTSETGPCALAAYEGIQVIAADVESDIQWRSSAFRDFALTHGLKSCWSTPIFSQAGLVLGTFAIYQNRPATPTLMQEDLIAQVTHIASIAIERSQREEALRRSEAFLAEGQKLARIGNFAWHVHTNKITWSAHLYRIYEFEVGIPITLDLIRTRVHPEDSTLYEKMVEYADTGGEDFEWQYRLVMPNNSIKYLHAVARATRDHDSQLEYIAAVQDITARRLSQEALDEARSELTHAARAMSLGVLTASIAHEVSQPLSGIITNASTSLRMLDGDLPNVDGAREIAHRIIRDGNRASDVISRLRALFRKKEFTAESVDLNEAAHEVIALSRSELQRSQVVVRTKFAKSLPLVRGDRVQLQQVILNLLLNAADAMGDIDGTRQLTISSKMDGKDQVQLSVSDVGVGFAPGEADKLFKAFYTTKQSGMGIGLSVSRSIIERHDGRLWATPNEVAGAVFSFSIPVEGSSENLSVAA